MKCFEYKNSSIAYEIVGDGRPVIFFHGWGVNHQIMSGCMEPIFQKVPGFKRIYIDLPGMGESKAGPEIHNSDDILEILHTFIVNELGEKEIMIMGESYGGYLARGFMHEHPKMVTSLILLCPLVFSGYRSGRTEKLEVKVKDCNFLATLTEEERNSFEFMNVILTEPVWKAYKRDILPGLVKKDQHFLDSVLDGACSFDVDKITTTYEQPVLILVGSGDTEVGFKDQFDLLANYQNASYHLINNGGHNMQIEQPEMFEAIVSTWLRSL